jgi:hypothetical protein
MGKAGTPYARTVPQTHPLPKNALPDPGLVFDTLLKREGVSLQLSSAMSLLTLGRKVCKTPGRAFKHDVLLCGSCYSQVSPSVHLVTGLM